MLIARLIAENLDLSGTESDGPTDESMRFALALRQMVMDFRLAAKSEVLSNGVTEITINRGSSQVREALRVAIDASFAPTDMLIADHVPRIPQVFVSDMDSTMIGQECIDELADFAGIKDQIAAITERAMQGELDFASALHERVLLLRGLSEGAIAECLATRILPMPGAKTLVETLKSKGCHTVLVTGGFHQFADPIAEMLGFERVVANRLEVADGRLTGGLVGGIVDSTVKEAVLREEVANRGGPSLATGDGANDIPMLEAASYGIAYHAKPKARAAADGWIDRGDLTDVLRLLGISREDWVEG